MKLKPLIDRIPENIPMQQQHQHAKSSNVVTSSNKPHRHITSIHKNDLDLSEDEDDRSKTAHTKRSSTSHSQPLATAKTENETPKKPAPEASVTKRVASDSVRKTPVTSNNHQQNEKPHDSNSHSKISHSKTPLSSSSTSNELAKSDATRTVPPKKDTTAASSSSESSSDEGSSSSDDDDYDADSSASGSSSSSGASSSSSSSASSSDNEEEAPSQKAAQPALFADILTSKLTTNFDDDEEGSNQELGSIFNNNNNNKPIHEDEEDNNGMTLTNLIKNIEENSNISPSKLSQQQQATNEVVAAPASEQKPLEDDNTMTFQFSEDEMDDDSQTSNHNKNFLVANEHSSSVSVSSVASNAAKKAEAISEPASAASTFVPDIEPFDTNVKSNESAMENGAENGTQRPESTSSFVTNEMNPVDEDKNAPMELSDPEEIIKDNLADVDDNATFRDEDSIRKAYDEPKEAAAKERSQLFSPTSPLRSQDGEEKRKIETAINLSFGNDDEEDKPKLMQFNEANLFKKSSSFINSSVNSEMSKEPLTIASEPNLRSGE